MKGTLHKTEQGWSVATIEEGDWNTYYPLHPEYQTILPLDLDLEGKEVEFDWCVIVDHNTGKGKEYAKLIDRDFQTKPGFVERRMALGKANNNKMWDEIYDEYSTDQYPAFGGPFTDSLSFIDWLKEYFIAPEKICY